MLCSDCPFKLNLMERLKEHGVSSFNDAGLWRKLLERAKKGTTKDSFFVVDTVVGSLQTSKFAKLGLPAEFLEHHRENLTENITLEGPDGHKWPVLLGQSLDSKPCLLQGWREFAADCDLAVNDQILFFLWETSHFLVQVFDSNHNIKRTGGGTSAHIARTTLPQATDPIQSFGFKTPTPTPLSTINNISASGVAKDVHKENHTTQASPSGEKLGNQEPGGEEDDDRVADFNAKFGGTAKSFQGAPPSDAEKDQALSVETGRNLNRMTTGCGRGGELHKSDLDPPGDTLTVGDYLSRNKSFVPLTARGPVRKRKQAEHFIAEKIPEKRARQAPTDRSKAVAARIYSHSAPRTPQTGPRKEASPDDPDSRATKSAPPALDGLWPCRYGGAAARAAEAAEVAGAVDTAKTKEVAEAAAEEGKAPAPAPVPASDPVTPLPVEAPRQAFKRPQPRSPPTAEAARAVDTAKAREAATENDKAPVPASDPATPLPVEAPRQAFKRPQPRNPLPRQLFYSKRRLVTQQEREAALEAGQRYAAASSNRTHVMQLRASQVYCGKTLGGALDFAAAMEFPLQGRKQVILSDGTGRGWVVVWHGVHPKRSGLASSGWTQFVLDHCLEEGDVCVFELPHRKVCNISVKVFPVVPVTPSISGWRDHYTVDEPEVLAVIQPAVEVGLDQATLRQPAAFEKEDSEMEGTRRRLSIDKNSWEKEKNKSCEEDESNETRKGCIAETRTEEKSMEEKRYEEQFCQEKEVQEKLT